MCVNKIPWYTHCEGDSFHRADGEAAIASIAGAAQYLMAVHWSGSTMDDEYPAWGTVGAAAASEKHLTSFRRGGGGGLILVTMVVMMW